MSEEELIQARKAIGLYSICELCTMFGCGRKKIDDACNSKKLRYISPNGKGRFIYLNDFIKFGEVQSETK
ncbi:MAG: hypothetical protein J6C53_01995 [Clostridia bacterium]|nr:hypothetical protein [Clostridia bacterium]